MKKAMMLAAAFALGFGMAMPAQAGGFNVKKCKACHSVKKDKAGPAWSKVAEAYGSADALAEVFKNGFKVSDRKMIQKESKWKSKAGLMTGQFKKMIKGHEEEAAKALFEAVERGKI